MALPAIDSFTGANGDPLSANWSVIDGTFVIFSNHLYGTSGSTNAAFWNADVFADDQYSQCSVTDGNLLAGPGVRFASLRGYFVQASSGSALLRRMDGDETFITLQDCGSAVAPGDVLRLEVQGSTLRVYKNGVQIGTDETDATYASGSAGVFYYSSHDDALDDFEGGNIGGGATGKPAGYYARLRGA